MVLDPNNGEIKALVSRPGFDPNWFVNGISEKNWNYINTDPFHPMTDKAIAGEYPPGSTFKIVTGSAALEEKKVTPDELIFDSGRHWLVDMRNAGGEALGWINFKRALSASDNVYFYEMGNRLGIDLLDQYAEKFGFGKKTGIDFMGRPQALLQPRLTRKRSLKTNGTWAIRSIQPLVRALPWQHPCRLRKCLRLWRPMESATSPIL